MWHTLGIDTTKKIEKQEGLIHRNEFNEISQCPRWVGYERTDRDWFDSGKASIEAYYQASDVGLRQELRNSSGSSAFHKQDYEILGNWLDDYTSSLDKDFSTTKVK